MKSLFIRKRASTEVVTKQLALPPGFRRIFMNQKIEGTTPEMMNGAVACNSPIQITDTTSPDFGKFQFMAGYDS